MTCYYCYLAYKDESNTTTSAPGTITASMINLKPLPPTPSRRTETLNHHHRPYRKAVGKSTLNKTDEHCRSLFNLLPTSLRPRSRHHQTSNNKGVDAVSMKKERKGERQRARIKKDLLRHIVLSTCVVTLHSSIINTHIHNKN
jgi:hypothetical protein